MSSSQIQPSAFTIEQEISLLRIIASAGLCPPLTDSQMDQVYADFCDFHKGHDITKSQMRSHILWVCGSSSTTKSLCAAITSLPSSVRTNSDEWRCIELFLVARVELICCIRGYGWRFLPPKHIQDGDRGHDISHVTENHCLLSHSLSNATCADNELESEGEDTIYVPKPTESILQSSNNVAVIDLNSDNEADDNVQQQPAFSTQVPTKRHRSPLITRTVKSRQNSLTRHGSASSPNRDSSNNNCSLSVEDVLHSNPICSSSVDLDASIFTDQPPLAQESVDIPNFLSDQDPRDFTDNHPTIPTLDSPTKTQPHILHGSGRENDAHNIAGASTINPRSEKNDNNSEIQPVHVVTNDSQPHSQELDEEIRQANLEELLSDVPPLIDTRPVQSPLDSEFMPTNLTKLEQSKNEKLSELIRCFDESRKQNNHHNNNQHNNKQCEDECTANNINHEDVHCNNKANR